MGFEADALGVSFCGVGAEGFRYHGGSMKLWLKP